jgi:hypothetical protein
MASSSLRDPRVLLREQMHDQERLRKRLEADERDFYARKREIQNSIAHLREGLSGSGAGIGGGSAIGGISGGGGSGAGLDYLGETGRSRSAYRERSRAPESIGGGLEPSLRRRSLAYEGDLGIHDAKLRIKYPCSQTTSAKQSCICITIISP